MARSNERIKKDIVDHLYWDVRVDASEVKVVVEDGKVTLSGTVPSFQARVAAEDDAYVIPGVYAVDNDIIVRYVNPLPSESELGDRVRSSLSWSPDIDSAGLEVNVENGVVTLNGTVSSLWEKLKAEEVATNVSQATKVVNDIAVVPTENLVDERIAEDITRALERIILTDTDKVDVTVRDGVVILDGKVPTWESRNLVVNIVHHTPGVKAIDERLMLGI